MIPIRGAMGYRLLLLGLAFALLASSVASLVFGAVNLAPGQVLGILAQRLFGLAPTAPDWTAGQDSIVWLIRAPRVLLGALVGAGLALAGCALQAATRNPLADPHLLGVSSGAALGAVVMVLAVGEVLGRYSLPLAAFAGSLLSLLLVLAIASREGRLASDRLLLAGVAVSFLMMALANLLLFLGDPHAATSVVFWMLGGLGMARWELLWLPGLCVGLALLVLVALGRGLNGLMSGEQSAVSLGLDPRRLRLLVFLCTSLLTGVLVSLSGAIGFVGLMLPHLARRLVGAEHRRLLPVCALAGAIFLVWVDVVSRTLLAPQDLPIGIATAAVGGGFFALLLRRRG